MDQTKNKVLAPGRVAVVPSPSRLFNAVLGSCSHLSPLRQVRAFKYTENVFADSLM
jgi:hypothetical protein